MEFKANISRMKHLKNDFKKFESKEVIQKSVSSNPFNDQIDQKLLIWKKIVFVLESNKEYFVSLIL